jgi:hypothetical protein
MHQLPIQYCGQTGFVDDEVAHPKVTVYQPRQRGLGPVGGQPPERPLEGRGGVTHLIQTVPPLGELIGLRHADAVGVGAMDGGQRLRALRQ